MPPSVEDQIQGQAKRAIASRCTRHAVLAALAVSTVLAAAGWLDQWLAWKPLPLSLALSAFLISLVTIAILWIKSLHQARGKHLLASLDRASSLNTGYVISTSAEFAGTSSSDPIEQAMLARLHHTAGELITTTTPQHPWPGKILLSTTALATAALASLLLTQGTQPIQRIFQPWKHLPYTTIKVAPLPDPLPVKGEPFSLHGMMFGRFTERGTLRMTSGGERTFPVQPDGRFEIRFPQGISATDTATIHAGKDGISTPIHLTFRLPPKVMNYSHEITPPRYTGHPPSYPSKPSFALIRGSHLRFGVTFQEQPGKVLFVFEDDRTPLALQPHPADPRQWSLDLGAVPRSFGYRLDVTDAHGALSHADEPQQIVATQDRPPSIQLVKNNTAEIKSRKETLKFNLEAKDDLGLSAIRVQAYRVGDPNTAPVDIARLDPTTPASRDWKHMWSLDLAAMNAKPMDMLVILFEAVDGNTLDGPGRAFTDPILFEVPEDPAEGEPAPSPPGGGSSGEPPETINPLAMQRQLYRETLQMSLGRGSLTMPDAAKRQREVSEAIKAMMEGLQDPDPEFLKLLRKANTTALQASIGFNGRTLPPRGRGSYNPLQLQETTIQLLLQAAQIERNAQKDPGSPPESPEAPPGPKPPPTYTLISPPSSSGEKQEEKQNQEEIDKALADIEQAREEQEKLNQQLAEKKAREEAESKEVQEGKEGKEGKEGASGESPGPPSPSDSPPQAPKGGKPGGTGSSGEPSDPNQEPQDPTDTPPNQDNNPQPTDGQENLTEKQLELAELSEAMIRKIEKLATANPQSDPKQAAEQMRRAAQLQHEAAQSLLQNASKDALSQGEDAQDALRRAGILTKALLDRAVTPGIDAGTRAPGYDDLIQGYSRRLSYDE